MVHSHESVTDMYKKLSSSSKSIMQGFGTGKFVGLRKSCTDVTEFHLTAIRWHICL